MCPMMLNSLSDGPAMVLSPPQEHAFVQYPHQTRFNPGADAHRGSFFTNGAHGFANSNNNFTAKPSRKRSRDDVGFDDGAPSSGGPVASAPAPLAQKEEKPIYGPGMVLLNPRTKIAISAESQTGTWYEESAEKTATTAAPVSSRSQMLHSGASDNLSRKSQRLDPTAPTVDDITLSSIQSRLDDTSNTDDNRRILPASSRLSPEEPTVDDATRLLGISWQRIVTEDSDMAAAVRGWKKYIDRQFSAYLMDSEILMKNRALNAYLVTARPITPMGPAFVPAFFLFSDDLTQAQLVGSNWELCLQNLRSNPIVFEGTQILNASDRPASSMPATATQNLLGATQAEPGLPLLQTLCAQPSMVDTGLGAGLNNSVGMGTGMEIDT
ncbi:uncharacterized protein BO97DRAFT_266935 [Aspergillus homomorphus CBS 101889]|uniref:Uncharacterized protein n=1 Tax=Aspergillus homomorphus (strain CBS 101889) TaxID=1450537 RepID=A0A395HGQ6_ASPHC|nr:hypothetical protein BO97DRAFT_266935 [Aspergillus homomorphus CBS 101889]RAL07092.1 hypothetical protein BO97DRAFT_266935 [Aspergillus homomorphus CBS 101889]